MSEKDVMSEVINDISSATAEAVEEAQEAAEEAAEEREEAAEEDTVPEDAETIVVVFEDEIDAARAVRVVNKALRKRHETIYQGAVVSREDEDDELIVEDLRDMGLSDVITGTAEIGIDLGRDGFRLAWTAASTGLALIAGGFRLLRRTALLTAGLAGSTWTIPRRRGLESFLSEEEIEAPTTSLEPGETAVVIVADHETAAEIATDLVRSGGEII